MPPFVSTECPNCQHRNRFDLAELRKNDASLVKDIMYRGNEKDDEIVVTCQHCGRKFKFMLKGGEHGTKKQTNINR